jgi:tRNA(adenine34) deaminase
MMRLALEEARHALHLGEIPIGAVVAADQEIIAEGFNQPIHSLDPTAHAEIIALRKAAKELGNYRLSGLTLYVTVEPCMMCIGAILHARIGTLVYGVTEPKFGAVESIQNLEEIRVPHRIALFSGVLEHDCRKIMQDFFKYRRDNL